MVTAFAIAPILSANPTEPGTYRNWNGDIDQVVVNRPFRADDYHDIQVEPLDITRTTVPERTGESRPATIALLPSFKPAFMASGPSALESNRFLQSADDVGFAIPKGPGDSEGAGED